MRNILKWSMLMIGPITWGLHPNNRPYLQQEAGQPADIQAQIYSVSPSACLVHAKLQTSGECGKHTDLLITIAVDKTTQLIGPDKKPTTLTQLLPGMRIRVQGMFTDRESIAADKIQLISRKIHLKRARLYGRVSRSDYHEIILLTKKQQMVRLQKWPGGMKLVGIEKRPFQQRGFAAVPSGSEIVVRGWYLEKDIILVNFLRFVK